MQKVVRTVCQACHIECGVLVHLQDDKIVRTTGDPAHPDTRGFVCLKAHAQPQFLDHPDRLKYPLKRVGERGSGQWQRVSWDQALDEIAARLTEIRDRHGPTAIGTLHGTGPRPSLMSTHALASALGSPNVVSVDVQICFVPSLTAQFSTWGAQILMDSGPDYLNSDCILVVGGNPLVSHPPRGMDILEAKRARKAKLIVVDPYRSELAARADLWLRVRPGTDAALILAMTRLIVDEGLYDRDFVDRWCYGFDELRDSLTEYSVEAAARITSVPADLIREAARQYATTKPAALHQRVGVEQNVNSTQTVRAIANMVALTGNVDVPGGNLLPAHGGGGGFPRLSPEVEWQRVGAREYPLTLGPESPMPMVFGPLGHDAIRDGRLKAVFCAGGNPVILMQNSRELRQSMLEKLDLHVVADFFMTPTAAIADYVLPAATWLERDDFCGALHMKSFSIRQKVVEPVGEARHDMDIVIDLVKRIPWADRKHLPWDSVEEFNEASVKGFGLTFAEANEQGYIPRHLRYKKYEQDGFATPTRKVELYATRFEKYGYEPLPSYREPPESPESAPDLAADYPLILYTGRRPIEYYHSQQRQIPSLRRRAPEALLEIHPDTAAQFGVGQGDWVWLETPQVPDERVRFKASLTTAVAPGMVHAGVGWWFPEKPGPDYGCFDSNVNVVLSDGPPREAICASARTRGTLCRVYK
ncbi:MAG: molybdopterin-dependent oxidoreductase [Dehalococcoidia bacterium]|nr:molybdopterin-dependent oxidoreductase [Dehalococcoidia bacterium]